MLRNLRQTRMQPSEVRENDGFESSATANGNPRLQLRFCGRSAHHYPIKKEAYYCKHLNPFRNILSLISSCDQPSSLLPAWTECCGSVSPIRPIHFCSYGWSLSTTRLRGRHFIIRVWSPFVTATLLSSFDQLHHRLRPVLQTIMPSGTALG